MEKIESTTGVRNKEFVTPESIKAQSGAKKQNCTKTTPANRIPAVKTTPKYFEICDSDTPSGGSSSEDDFNPNDTWNASSDEEYKNEAERIKKRSIARISRRDEEIVFVADDSTGVKKKLDDLANRFEFKKLPGMPGTETPSKVAKPSKRKLFTHSHFDDDANFDITLDDEERKENREENKIKDNVSIMPEIPFLKKIATNKAETPQLPSVKKTGKAKANSNSKVVDNKFAKYSFLKSLDVEANTLLCDPEALSYRKNFKSKKIELTERLFKLYDDKVFGGQLSEVATKWNKKLLNTAGRCNNSRRGGMRQSQLELSDKVLTSADRLRCTLIHEMCHAVTWVSFE